MDEKMREFLDRLKRNILDSYNCEEGGFELENGDVADIIELIGWVKKMMSISL